MSHSGRCNCGAVTATMTGEPVGVRQCWCRQCQKAAGGGGTYNAIFLADDVQLTGELRSWSYIADSGNTATMHSCAICSTPIFGQSSAFAQFSAFRLGFLDEDHGLAPEGTIWASETPAWAKLDPEMDNWPQQTPPPPQAT